MLASLRRSASASAAICTNSLPRWLISITDMPAWCQLTSSHFAFSSTSTGIVAGPAPKLKMRAAGWILGAGVAIGVCLAGAVGKVVRLRFGAGVAAAVAVGAAMAVSIAVAVLAVLVVAVEDALQAGKPFPFAQVDQRD